MCGDAGSATALYGGWPRDAPNAAGDGSGSSGWSSYFSVEDAVSKRKANASGAHQALDRDVGGRRYSDGRLARHIYRLDQLAGIYLACGNVRTFTARRIVMVDSTGNVSFCSANPL